MLRDAYIFIIPLVALALVCLWLGFESSSLFHIGAIVFLLLAAFVAFFFRNPRRDTPVDESLVVAPADGRVVAVKKEKAGDAQSNTLVSIFLSVFDVHVNRSPVSGTITRTEYRKGKFIIATRERASAENEQNIVTVENERVQVVFKQIAGVIARRIVFWKKEGDRVALGEAVGLIKFGSRTDLLLPPAVEVSVRPGDRVKGGISIIGRMSE